MDSMHPDQVARLLNELAMDRATVDMHCQVTRADVLRRASDMVHIFDTPVDDSTVRRYSDAVNLCQKVFDCQHKQTSDTGGAGNLCQMVLEGRNMNACKDLEELGPVWLEKEQAQKSTHKRVHRANATHTYVCNIAPLFQNGPKNPDLRCVFHPAPVSNSVLKGEPPFH